MESLASASRGGDRFDFQDTVGWIELGGRMAVVAFVPFMLSTAQREAVVRGRGVFPAIEPYQPMVEMRFELKPEVSRLVVDDINAVQLTFWHFATPAPVVRIGPEDLAGEASSMLVGLDGEARKGGWCIGTVRGQQVVPTAAGRNIAYTWNLAFQSNFG